MSEQAKRHWDKVKDLLACPACKSTQLVVQNNQVRCLCGISYPIVRGVPIMIQNARAEDYLPGKYETMDVLSQHDYSPRAKTLIGQYSKGLILDLGAGAKNFSQENIVQLDIFLFPETDIVAQGEALPFKENSFNAVISQAVFEHLRYPELVAAELYRVCKPNAKLKIDTAFLQPVHAYPDHYYNATLEGLKQWFQAFEIEWEGVESYQHPWMTLYWILDAYLAGITDNEKKTQLLNSSVKELYKVLSALRDNQSDTALADVLLTLSYKKQLELASGVSVEVKKTVSAKKEVTYVKQTGIITSSYQVLQLNNRIAELERELNEVKYWLKEKNALLRIKNELIDRLDREVVITNRSWMWYITQLIPQKIAKLRQKWGIK